MRRKMVSLFMVRRLWLLYKDTKKKATMAQVWKKGWDLRRKTGPYALQWRRSPQKNHTCANNTRHLRQKGPTPAPYKPGGWCMWLAPRANRPNLHFYFELTRQNAQALCSFISISLYL